jgi:hypothetical protein
VLQPDAVHVPVAGAVPLRRHGRGPRDARLRPRPGSAQCVQPASQRMLRYVPTCCQLDIGNMYKYKIQTTDVCFAAATGTSSSAPAGGSTAPSSGTPTDAAAAPVAGPAGTKPSGGGVKSDSGMVDSAAVAADCKGISAAVVLAMGASFLAASVL